MSWRRRFICSKSSFNSRLEDDSIVFFPVRLSFLLPGGRVNSSSSSTSMSTTSFRSTLRASDVGVSGSTEDDVFDHLARRLLLDVMVPTRAHFGLFRSRSQHL
ncbi:hypothetical protein HanRHA438_Chr06g0262011 [Helianthus annuus]|nr:hypothetical protein HanRHA438_Chr06g0262011 [Helianthus annuus]